MENYFNLKAKSYKLKPKNGFTLIEILIVIGLVTVIAIVAFLGLSSYRQRVALNEASQAIAAVLRDAHQRAVNQEAGKDWGVHFEQVAGGRDFYALFNGPSYLSPISTFYLPAGVEFSDPASGGKDIIFQKLTGIPTAASSISVFLAGNPAASKIININALGQIQY